jgi:hypothetical protein
MLVSDAYLDFNLTAHAIVYNIGWLQHESPQHQSLAFAPVHGATSAVAPTDLPL